MIDYIFLAYIFLNLFKGFINGVGKEIEKICFTLLLLCSILGVFVISEFIGLIKSTLQTLLTSTGFWVSFSSFILAIFLFYSMRSKISVIAEEILTPKYSNYGGLLVAFLRSCIVIFLFILVLKWLPFGLFNDLLQQSVVAQPMLELLNYRG